MSCIFLSTAFMVSLAAPANRQGLPTIQTQDVILQDPDGLTGFGSNAKWIEPYLVVANRQQSQVNLFKRTSTGWDHLDQVEAQIAGFNLFARAIEVNQEWIFVSDPTHDSNSGLITILRRMGERLVRNGQLFSPAQGQDGFGTELSSAGDWLVVTSPNQNNFAGAAHVYQLQGENWIHMQEIPPSIPSTEPFAAGCAISESGVLVIGQAEKSGGTLHVYTLSNGQWNLDQILEDSNVVTQIASTDNFGRAIAVSPDGRCIVAGDRHGEAAGVFFAGEAFVFERFGPPGTSTWVEVGNLRASNDFINFGSATAEFGTSVAIHGNTILVGAPNAIGQVNPLEGAIYGFRPDVNGSWPVFEEFRLVRNPVFGGGIGRNIEFDGSTVFAGPSVGHSGLSIYELGIGSVRCDGLPGATLNALGDPLTSGLTVGIHHVAPGSAVQLFACLNNGMPITPSPSTGLCLSSEALRIGTPIMNVGLGGNAYIIGLRLPQVLGCQPALCGDSLLFQATITPAPIGPFLTSQAVSVSLK